jgi:hypothetical protein
VQKQTLKLTLETTMFKGIAGQIVLALALIIALPMALEAQESARIRVSVRVISSVLPETQAAAATQIANIAETDIDEIRIEKQSAQTERGFAQVTTESLIDAADVAAELSAVADEADVDTDKASVLMTVAYTAN